MNIKQLIDEDFVNYKKASMFIGFPICSWKCEMEFGEKICQNSSLSKSPEINIKAEDIVKRYMENELTHAIVCGGLEPFNSWEDLYYLVKCFRKYILDDIVIYTGYYENEIGDYIKKLSEFPNIIVKFGRYIPNQKSHYDEILGVELASDNQYAKVISKEINDGINHG